MKFFCLAYGDAKDWRDLSKEQQDELLMQDEVLRKRGALMAAVNHCERLGWQPKRQRQPSRDFGPARRGLLSY
jgi:hypothetical protein